MRPPYPRVAPHDAPSPLARPPPDHGDPLAGGHCADLLELHVADHAAAPQRGDHRRGAGPAAAPRRRGPRGAAAAPRRGRGERGPPAAGAGPSFERVFRTRIRETDVSPEALVTRIAPDLNQIAPGE